MYLSSVFPLVLLSAVLNVIVILCTKFVPGGRSWISTGVLLPISGERSMALRVRGLRK